MEMSSVFHPAGHPPMTEPHGLPHPNTPNRALLEGGATRVPAHPHPFLSTTLPPPMQTDTLLSHNRGSPLRICLRRDLPVIVVTQLAQTC